MRIKTCAQIVGIFVVGALLSYACIYYLILSQIVIVRSGAHVARDILLEEGTIQIGNGSMFIGNISLQEGTILLGQNVTVTGNIWLEQGQLILKKGTRIEGNVQIDSGVIDLQENVHIQGDLEVQFGAVQRHSTSQITGNAPDIFTTTDYPEALRYFGMIPEDQKKMVGYIFLTKDGNTRTLETEEQTSANEYFSGIYFYADGKLQNIDLHKEEEIAVFFKQAQKFFESIAEHRRDIYDVGATTKKYAHNSDFADIYIPEHGSYFTFVHEMGHVVDFALDFSDFYDPVYPFQGKEFALNNYGATHPGEDFAEAYKYYLLNRNYFLELGEKKEEIQMKYDYLEEYVFGGKEYIFPERFS